MFRTIRRDRLVGALTTLTLVVAGCGGGGTTATQTASSSVTPEAGGTVTLPGSAATLDIPAGAVSSPTMITVSTTTDKPPAGITAASPILKFEPDGLVFEKPVTVTFTFKSATHPVVYWSNAQGGYDAIGGTVSGTTIAAEVTHFSSGFVGEASGGTATCAEGLACNGAATCTYGSGGNLSPGGDTNPMSAPKDPGSAPTSGGSSGTGTGAPPASGGNTAPPNAGTSPDVRSALTSSMCCACAKDGVFHCGPCPSMCAEGAACGTEGWMCNAATNTGLNPNPGSGDTAPKDPGTAPSASSALSSDSCCLCGGDGKFHCGMACVGGDAPKGDGGTNTGTPPISGGLDAGGTNPGSVCAPGAACTPGGGGCGNGSPTSCLQCQCGADGKLACTACPSNGAAGAGGDPIDPGTGGTCEPGAVCTPGGPDCGNGSPSSCLKCHCGADGKYACESCASNGGFDGGAPPLGGGADAGAPAPKCMPGAPCAEVGAGCGGGSPGGACMKCMCGDDLKYACMPCA